MSRSEASVPGLAASTVLPQHLHNTTAGSPQIKRSQTQQSHVHLRSSPRSRPPPLLPHSVHQMWVIKWHPADGEAVTSTLWREGYQVICGHLFKPPQDRNLWKLPWAGLKPRLGPVPVSNFGTPSFRPPLNPIFLLLPTAQTSPWFPFLLIWYNFSLQNTVLTFQIQFEHHITSCSLLSSDYSSKDWLFYSHSFWTWGSEELSVSLSHSLTWHFRKSFSKGNVRIADRLIKNHPLSGLLLLSLFVFRF